MARLRAEEPDAMEELGGALCGADSREGAGATDAIMPSILPRWSVHFMIRWVILVGKA